MKDAQGHGSNGRSLAAHQAGIAAALTVSRMARNADDETLVGISKQQRAAVGNAQSKMAAQQRGEAWK